jgi:NhaP-type Na+/H+ or K+/H+ antiporter
VALTVRCVASRAVAAWCLTPPSPLPGPFTNGVCFPVQVVHAQMALWVSCVVLFTITVNATALGPLMVALGLNKSTPLQRKLHRLGGTDRLVLTTTTHSFKEPLGCQPD